MQQIIEKIGKWWLDATKYLSKKKKELNKTLKPSKVVDVIRWIIVGIIVLAALSAIVTFVIYGAVLLLLLVGVYFVMPTDFLKEATTKISKSAMKLQDKKLKPAKKTRKASKTKPKAKKQEKPTNPETPNP